jgi:hypothetical protein
MTIKRCPICSEKYEKFDNDYFVESDCPNHKNHDIYTNNRKNNLEE